MKIIKKYLTPNPYSRPQKPLNKVKGIVIHWVANPNTTALANRNYFESKKDGKKGYGSAHEIIDLNGDIVLCIPENEMAYHVGSKTYTQKAVKKLSSYPNNCTYGIECCHIDWQGRMTEETYNSLVERVSELCRKWNLDPLKDVWLHKEVIGWKDCHKWFVDNPKEWEKFKREVLNRVDVYLNGEKLENKAVIINGVSYLPVREIGEKLGLQVQWNGEKREIYLRSES